MAPTINSLPNEILFEIASLLTQSRHQNRDLKNLALTCRCWVPIIREVLICSPQVDAAQLPSYFYALTRRPDLIPKVKSLQLSSQFYSNKVFPGWHKPSAAYDKPTSILQWFRAVQNAECMDHETRVFSMRLKSAIQSVLQISTYIHPLHDVTQWKDKLDDYVIPAMIALLLSILTGLKELRLSEIQIDHTPCFFTYLWGVDENSRGHYRERDRKHFEFLTAPIVKLLEEKLEVLEYPRDFQWFMWRRRDWDRLALYSFSALKMLSISLNVLSMNMSAEEVFPKRMVCLRVTYADEVEEPWLARGLCSAHRRGMFPHLKRLEVQYTGMFISNILQISDPPNWYALPAICADAGLELLLCWPQYRSFHHAQTVLSYRQDGLPVEIKVEGSLEEPLRLEREWNAMGDVVMSSPNLPWDSAGGAT